MLTIQEIILIFALIGVLGGWAMGRIGARFGKRQKDEVRSGGGEGVYHRIRALEADLRVAQRKAEEAELAVERQREETDALRRDLQASAAALVERDEEVRRLRQGLSDECSKTQSLRLELTNRAEETIRASVRVKDAETELSVARAGSDQVLDQIQRLAAEREELTGRLRALQAEVAGRPRQPKVTRLPLRDPKDR
jgi:predicted  nucleic acid-binding Zn-ribbon protein